MVHTWNLWHPLLIFTEELALWWEHVWLVKCPISDVPKLIRRLLLSEWIFSDSVRSNPESSEETAYPILQYPTSTRSTELAKEHVVGVLRCMLRCLSSCLIERHLGDFGCYSECRARPSLHTPMSIKLLKGQLSERLMLTRQFSQ